MDEHWRAIQTSIEKIYKHERVVWKKCHQGQVFEQQGLLDILWHNAPYLMDILRVFRNSMLIQRGLLYAWCKYIWVLWFAKQRLGFRHANKDWIFDMPIRIGLLDFLIYNASCYAKRMIWMSEATWLMHDNELFTGYTKCSCCGRWEIRARIRNIKTWFSDTYFRINSCHASGLDWKHGESLYLSSLPLSQYVRYLHELP